MLRRRILFVILLLLAIPALRAHAHANLLSSDPLANSNLPEAPAEIRLFFSEPLESQFSKIELRNVQGEVLDLPPAQVDPDDDKQLVLIPGSLDDGIYTVVWRVVSQTDGHLTQGSYPFNIGDAIDLAVTPSSVGDESIPVDSALIRWVNFLSLVVLIGSSAFWLGVWLPRETGDYTRIEFRMRRVIWVGWVAVGVSSVLVAVLQAQIVSGGEWSAALNTLAQVLGTTRFGQLWLARVVLWLLFGVILWRGWRGTFQNQQVLTILLGLGAAILLTQSLFSHASGAVDTTPAVIADWMHLLAMSIWIGGLFQLIVVASSMRNNPSPLSVLVARFSNLARMSVALLIVTGAFAGWLQVGSLDALRTTPYGQVLAVKLALFLPLLAIGAINMFFTHQGLQAGKLIWSRRLRYLISLEITLSVAILVAVGLMTATVPARITAARSVPVASTSNIPFFEMAVIDNIMIHFAIDPGSVGENTFFIDVYDLDSGNLVDDASLIRLRFEKTKENIGESELRTDTQTNNQYILSGSNLSSSGEWRIRMTIQRPGHFDIVADFEPMVSFPGALAPPIDPNPDETERGIALLLAGLLGVGSCSAFLFNSRPWSLNLQTGLIVVFLVGCLVLTSQGGNLVAKTVKSDLELPTQPNPIPATVESIELGKQLYMANCIQCHGITGQGDGPASASLNPPPANLAIHTAPGGHTDGELFGWISNGVSFTSAMPAFSDVLTEEERWHLVNYIRQFGLQSEQ